MLNRPLVIAIVAVGCVAAAGLGGFLAVRFNSDAPAAATLSGQAVTENIVTPEPSAPPTATSTPSSQVHAAPPSQPALEANPAPTPKATPSIRTQNSQSASDRATPAPTRPVARPAPPAPPPLDQGQPSVPATAPAASTPTPPLTVETPETAPSKPVLPPEPPRPEYEELKVKSDSVIGIRLDTPLTSRTAKVEDRVAARVSRDVIVDGRVAIPSGARLEGTVTTVETGDKFTKRARLGVKFNTIVLADKTRLPIDTETIFRDGDSPSGEAASKIGASAVVGAILGAVVGGKKGAAIGSAAGAGGGTAAVMAGGVNDATLDAGTPLTVRLNAPVTVLVEKQQNHDGE